VKLRDPERVDAIAGEYVLGTLGGRARARFERLLRTERRVADAVRAWEDRLLPLAEGIPPRVPPAHVWTAILARIAGTTARSAPRLGVRWWRGLALASVAVACALAVALFQTASERAQGTIVIVLAGPDAKPALLASADRSSRYLSLQALAPLAVADDRALELWLLPGHGNPRSLGLVPAVAPAATARIALPETAARALQNIPALAVSLEPKGGSPTGLPTGPVLYSGPVQGLD
jgi:anti-sigma-K factor RskA